MFQPRLELSLVLPLAVYKASDTADAERHEQQKMTKQ
jgi:hypothetical protein